MTLIEDGRLVHTRARYQDLTDIDDLYPPGPFGLWQETVQATADRQLPCDDDPTSLCSIGNTWANADQHSEFYEAGIQFEGVIGGGWQGEPDGSHDENNVARFKFRIDQTVQYTLTMICSPPDTPSIGLATAYVKLEGPDGVQIRFLEDGSLSETARLGPGEYVLEGLSWGDTSDQYFVGGYFFAQWIVQVIPQPLLPHQPQDATVACGGTATFTAGPNVPGMTYQWYCNGQPLSNGGHISGATSSTLTIGGACLSDAGRYNVVATSGSITEPSRYAQLSIQSAVTGVEQQDAPLQPFSIRVAGANPFHGSTSFRYVAATPQPAKVAIYNVSGAMVRLLKNGTLSGSGMVAWDGKDESGANAPSGIYFLRAETASGRTALKVALMR
jgi:hypothetical protein